MKDVTKHNIEYPSPKLISPVKEDLAIQPSVKFPKLEPIKKYEHYPINNNIFTSNETVD
jgi:hypothetical protein